LFFLISLVLVLALTLPATPVGANLVLNGGFEDGSLGQFSAVPIPNWNVWGWSGWHHNDIGYKFDGKAVKEWWDDSGLWQDFPVAERAAYDFSVWAITAAYEPLSGWDGVFRVEWYDDNWDEISHEEIGRFYGAKDPCSQGHPGDPAEVWKFISGTKTAPAGAVNGRVVLCLVDGDGYWPWHSEHSGAVNWDDVSVTAAAVTAYNHNPVDEATGINPDVTLSWSPGIDANSHDVYFGTDFNDVNDADTSSSQYKANQAFDANSYDPCGLEFDTIYYWRIDEVNDSAPNSPWTGNIWSFTTIAKPANCLAGDLNGDCQVSLEDLFTFAGQWLDQTGCSDFNCADLDDSNSVNMSDFAMLAQNWLAKVNPLVINELMASNSSCIQDPQGDYDDWIEIYNAGGIDIDIGLMYLTDDLNEPTKWQFPSATAVPAHGYLLIWADGDNEQGDTHTNFKLSAGGEQLGLFDTDGSTLIDSVIFDTQATDISYGRSPDFSDNWRFFDTPTPAAQNKGGYLGFVAGTEFSIARGFYETSPNVAITCQTPVAKIYYTLDGSEPRETGTEYDSPIPISTTTCLRARAFKPDWLPSTTKTNTYLINISEAIKSLPAISIVGDQEQSLYEPNGIMAIVGGYYDENGVWHPSGPNSYNNPIHRGIKYERPVSVELIKPADNTGFQSDCGIRVHGSDYHRPRYTRGDNWQYNYDKFSFKLYFRSSYGENRLEYPLFPASSIDRYRSIVLRGGHNDVYNPFIKDELIRRLHKDIGAVDGIGIFVNIFINGEYKAFYNPCERIDEEFLQEWYGSDEDWDVITQSGVRDGDAVAWNALLDYARNHDLSDSVHYQEVAGRLDITAFIDYLILELYSGNWDWPGNNWTVAAEHSDEGIFRFYVWDAEGAMDAWALGEHLEKTGFNDFPIWNPQGLNGLETPIPWLYRALKANDDFRQLFADRIQKHFYNDGKLTNANIEMRFFELRDEMLGALPNMDMFIPDTFIPQRRGVMLDAFVEEDLFPSFEAPIFSINGAYQHGGYISAGDILTIDAPQYSTVTLVSSGSNWLYLDNGTDQGTGWRNPSFDDSSWDEGPAQFGYGDGDEATVVSYGPDPDNKYITTYFRHTFEANDVNQFTAITLKLLRDDGAVIYLNGTEIARCDNMPEGTIDYLTTALTWIEGETFIEFSVDPNLLVDGNNVIAVEVHQCSGTSSDISFDLELEADVTESVVTGTIYYTTDGNDPRLPGGEVNTASASDYNDTGPVTLTETTTVKARIFDGDEWSALSEATFTVGSAALFINEFMADNETIIEDPDEPGEYPDWLELYNAGTDTVVLAGMYLTDDLSNPTKWLIPDGLSIAPGGYLLFLADDDNQQGDTHTNFKLGASGEEIGLFDTDGTTQLDSIVFGQQFADISYGRYPDGTDNLGFFIPPTPGTANGPHSEP